MTKQKAGYNWFRALLAFLIGSVGVMLAFYGAVDVPHHQVALGLLLIVVGVVLLLLSFRLAPQEV